MFLVDCIFQRAVTPIFEPSDKTISTTKSSIKGNSEKNFRLESCDYLPRPKACFRLFDASDRSKGCLNVEHAGDSVETGVKEEQQPQTETELISTGGKNQSYKYAKKT